MNMRRLLCFEKPQGSHKVPPSAHPVLGRLLQGRQGDCTTALGELYRNQRCFLVRGYLEASSVVISISCRRSATSDNLGFPRIRHDILLDYLQISLEAI